jgi:hypothetical protein
LGLKLPKKERKLRRLLLFGVFRFLGRENVLANLCCNIHVSEHIWLNVLSVRRKLANLRRLGRWLEGKTRAGKEPNSQLGFLNAAAKPSGQY